MKYAITGATGHFGQHAINTLLTKVNASDVVAIVRNISKAQELLPAEVTIRQADYTDPEQLTTALTGVDKLLFISSQPGAAVSRLQQHLNVVNAAKEAGVSFIAYTSFPHADKATSPLSADHKATEAAIEQTGIAHSFLRNNWYLENELGLILAVNAGKPFIYSAGDGKVGWSLEQDYAEAAALVLTTDNPKSVYEFAGPSHTFSELGAVVSEQAAKNAHVRSVSDKEYADYLKSEDQLDEQSIATILAIQDLIRAGELSEDTDDLATVLQRPIASLGEMVKDVMKEDR